MEKFPNLTFTFILGALVLASCSSNKMTASSTPDNLYFMASDATLATEYAVQNNNPDQFQSYSNLDEQQVPQENFSSRNVNPDYIARYQAEPLDTLDDVVYFDEGGVDGADGDPDINVYNNYIVGNTGNGFNRFGSPMGFMGGFSPFGMGGFYDPFWGPGFGFRPGFNMSIGFGMGFGRSFFGSRFGMGGFGMGGFYDPFYNPFFGSGFGFGGFPGYGLAMGGYPGYGFGGFGNPYFGNRPIYVLPGGEFGDRRVIRGNRPSRGATLAGAGMGSSSALQPSTARAQARRDVLNSNGTSSRRLVSSPNSRSSARDFSSSQNDYYNSANSRVTSTRNVRSAAMNRSSVNTRSAMPTSRPAIRSTNTRNNSGINRGGFNNRTGSPSYNRSTSPSYNRGTMPGRVGSPSYNRGGTNNRFTPSRSVTPSRSTPTRSTPSYSAPSRSSGGSVGGGSRGGGGASTGSRGGRGN